MLKVSLPQEGNMHKYATKQDYFETNIVHILVMT